MIRTMLKSKIHRATVTQADLHYVGSITIDDELLGAADIVENELVHVLNVSNGARFETYAIGGGPGQVCLNGAAARLAAPGDIVIVVAYAGVDEREVPCHRPKVVFVDEGNAIVDHLPGAEKVG